jgi:multiple sugar transport system substrate-binding protein
VKGIIYRIILAFVVISSAVVAGVSLHFEQNMSSYALAYPQSNKNITITEISNQFNIKDMGKSLVDSAADKLRSNHPDLHIRVKYIETGLDNKNTRNQILKAITNGTSVDIVTLDQIWLGEFAQKVC